MKLDHNCVRWFGVVVTWNPLARPQIKFCAGIYLPGPSVPSPSSSGAPKSARKIWPINCTKLVRAIIASEMLFWIIWSGFLRIWCSPFLRVLKFRTLPITRQNHTSYPVVLAFIRARIFRRTPLVPLVRRASHLVRQGWGHHSNMFSSKWSWVTSRNL